ncbi:hypothetical protein HDU76_003959, partial [Blyttiomyces sp. JEL0837]
MLDNSDDANIPRMEDFEHAKENILPRPKGRSAKLLAQMYSDPSSTSGDGSSKSTASSSTTTGSAGEVAASGQEKPNKYLHAPTMPITSSQDESERISIEREIAALTEDSDDPLDPYHRLLVWYQDRYPSGHPKHASLLETAVRAFRKDPRYKEDPRFIRMWLQVARKAKEPEDVFKYLATNAIGQGSAIYYEEYAAFLESKKRFREVDDIFQLGINRKAVPVDRLQKKFALFQRRMILSKPDPQDDSEPRAPAAAKPAQVRSVLGTTAAPEAAARPDVTTQPVRAPIPTQPARQTRPVATGDASLSQPHQHQHQQQGQSSSKGSFQIFRDQDSGSGTVSGHPGESGTWDEFGNEELRAKENTVEAKPWKGTTMPQLKTEGEQQAYSGTFQVFQDESEHSHNAQFKTSTAAVFTEKPTELDPRCAAILQETAIVEIPHKSQQQPVASHKQSENRTEVHQPTVASKATNIPQMHKTERLVCDLNLFNTNNQEFSFEEIRANLPKYSTVEHSMNAKSEKLNASQMLRGVAGVVEKESVLSSGSSKPRIAPAVPIKDETSPFDCSDKPAPSTLVQEKPKSSTSSPAKSRETPRDGTPEPEEDEPQSNSQGYQDFIVPIKSIGFSTKAKQYASPTINTKAALADVFEMFNAPLPQKQESESVGSHVIASSVPVQGHPQKDDFAGFEDDDDEDADDLMNEKPAWYEIETDETISAQVYKPVESAKIGIFRDDGSEEEEDGRGTGIGVYRDDGDDAAGPAVPAASTKFTIMADENGVPPPFTDENGAARPAIQPRKPLGVKTGSVQPASPVADSGSPFMDSKENLSANAKQLSHRDSPIALRDVSTAPLAMATLPHYVTAVKGDSLGPRTTTGSNDVGLAVSVSSAQHVLSRFHEDVIPTTDALRGIEMDELDDDDVVGPDNSHPQISLDRENISPRRVYPTQPHHRVNMAFGR